VYPTAAAVVIAGTVSACWTVGVTTTSAGASAPPPLGESDAEFTGPIPAGDTLFNFAANCMCKNGGYGTTTLLSVFSFNNRAQLPEILTALEGVVEATLKLPVGKLFTAVLF
jgi:hypothetical protein